MFDHMPLNGQIGQTFQQMGGFNSSSALEQIMRQFPGISMQQAEMYMRQNGMGGAGGMGQGGIGMNGMPSSLQSILGMQQTDNQWARDNNQREWNDAKANLQSVLPGYDNDAMNVGARGLTSQLLANPESINDQTQQQIMNRAQTLNTANNQARLSAAAMDAAERGLSGGGQVSALQDSIRGDNARQMAQTASGLDIDRAMRRTQDFTNAIKLGSDQAQFRGNLAQQNAATHVQGLPQYKADDYSGLAAILAQQQAGGGFGRAPVGPQIGNVRYGQGLNAGGFNFGGMQESVNPYYGNRPTNSYFGGGTAIQTQNPYLEYQQGGQMRQTGYNPNPFAPQGGARPGWGA